MNRILYTSDLHFGHYNIIKYEDRPFTTLDDMTQGLIYRWNKKVDTNDTVYILGDFAFISGKLPTLEVNKILGKLNGEKHLIVGNHDTWINKKLFNPRMFESINYYLEIKDKNRDVVLCHYPLESWNGMRYGTIHLHGHLHSIPTKLNLQNRYNVGCDNWNYEPVTLDEIIQSKRDYNI